MTQKQLVTSKFQAISLKTRIEYSMYEKIQREIKKYLCRFKIKIRNYYFSLLIVARNNFF